MLGWLFKRPEPPVETRSVMTSGYTAQIMAARESYVTRRSGLAELTAAVQTSVSLWEAGFAMADVQGTSLLTRRSMAPSLAMNPFMPTLKKNGCPAVIGATLALWF